MDEQEGEEFLKMIGLKGIVPVLDFLNEKEAQYKDLFQVVSAVSLNTRLKQLLHFRLIEHHLERIEKKREWYTITDKGRKILSHLDEILELIHWPSSHSGKSMPRNPPRSTLTQQMRGSGLSTPWRKVQSLILSLME